MDTADKRYKLFLRIARKYAITLADEKDRILALKWLQKIHSTTEPTAQKTKHHALKLLIICLQRKKLVGPFAKAPEDKPLLAHGWAFQPADIARLILEEEFEKLGKPPMSIEISGNLSEYVAYQTIPSFGAHFFYAFSPERIRLWDNLKENIIPRGLLNITVISTPDTSILAKTVKETAARKRRVVVLKAEPKKKDEQFAEASVIHATGEMKKGFMREEPEAKGVDTGLISTAIDAGVVKEGEIAIDAGFLGDDQVRGPHMESVKIQKGPKSTVKKKKKNVTPAVEPILDGVDHWIETREEYEARRKIELAREKQELFKKMPAGLRRRLEAQMEQLEIDIAEELGEPKPVFKPPRTPEKFKPETASKKGTPKRKYRPEQFELDTDEQFKDAVEVFKDLDFEPPPTVSPDEAEKLSQPESIRLSQAETRRVGEVEAATPCPAIEPSPPLTAPPRMKDTRLVRIGMPYTKSDDLKTPEGLPLNLTQEIEASWERSVERMMGQRKRSPKEMCELTPRKRVLLQRLEQLKQVQPKRLVFDETDNIEAEPEEVAFEKFVYTEFPDEDKRPSILEEDQMEIADVFGEMEVAPIEELPAPPEEPGLEMIENAQILLETEMETGDIFTESEVEDPRVIFKEINVKEDRAVAEGDEVCPREGSVTVTRRIMEIPGEEPIVQTIFEESGEPFFDDTLKAIDEDHTPPLSDSMLDTILDKKLQQLDSGRTPPRTYGPWAESFKKDVERIERGESPLAEEDFMGEDKDFLEPRIEGEIPGKRSLIDEDEMLIDDVFGEDQVEEPCPIKDIPPILDTDERERRAELRGLPGIAAPVGTEDVTIEDLTDEGSILDEDLIDREVEMKFAPCPPRTSTPQPAMPAEVSEGGPEISYGPVSILELSEDDEAFLREVFGTLSEESLQELRQKRRPDGRLDQSSWDEEQFDRLSARAARLRGETSLTPAKMALARSVQLTKDFEKLQNRLRALRGLPPLEEGAVVLEPSPPPTTQELFSHLYDSTVGDAATVTRDISIEGSLSQAILKPEPESIEEVAEILDGIDIEEEMINDFADLENFDSATVAGISPTRLALAKSIKASMDFVKLRNRLKALRGVPLVPEPLGYPHMREYLDYDKTMFDKEAPPPALGEPIPEAVEPPLIPTRREPLQKIPMPCAPAKAPIDTFQVFVPPSEVLPAPVIVTRGRGPVSPTVRTATARSPTMRTPTARSPPISGLPIEELTEESFPQGPPDTTFHVFVPPSEVLPAPIIVTRGRGPVCPTARTPTVTTPTERSPTMRTPQPQIAPISGLPIEELAEESFPQGPPDTSFHVFVPPSEVLPAPIIVTRGRSPGSVTARTPTAPQSQITPMRPSPGTPGEPPGVQRILPEISSEQMLGDESYPSGAPDVSVQVHVPPEELEDLLQFKDDIGPVCPSRDRYGMAPVELTGEMLTDVSPPLFPPTPPARRVQFKTPPRVPVPRQLFTSPATPAGSPCIPEIIITPASPAKGPQSPSGRPMSPPCPPRTPPCPLPTRKSGRTLEDRFREIATAKPDDRLPLDMDPAERIYRLMARTPKIEVVALPPKTGFSPTEYITKEFPREPETIEATEFPEVELPYEEPVYGPLYHALFIPTAEEEKEIEAAQAAHIARVESASLPATAPCAPPTAPCPPPRAPCPLPVGYGEYSPSEMGFKWLANYTPFEDIVQEKRLEEEQKIRRAHRISGRKGRSGVTSELEIIKQIKPGEEILVSKSTVSRGTEAKPFMSKSLVESAARLSKPKVIRAQTESPEVVAPRKVISREQLEKSVARLTQQKKQVEPEETPRRRKPSLSKSQAEALTARLTKGKTIEIPGAPTPINLRSVLKKRPCPPPEGEPPCPERTPLRRVTSKSVRFITPTKSPCPVVRTPSYPPTGPSPCPLVRKIAPPPCPPAEPPPCPIAQPAPYPQPPQSIGGTAPCPISATPVRATIYMPPEASAGPPAELPPCPIAQPAPCPQPQVPQNIEGAAPCPVPSTTPGRARIYMPPQAIEAARRRRAAAALAAAAKKPPQTGQISQLPKLMDKRGLTQKMTAVAVGKDKRVEKSTKIQIDRDAATGTKTMVKENVVTTRRPGNVNTKQYKFAVRKGPNVGKRC